MTRRHGRLALGGGLAATILAGCGGTSNPVVTFSAPPAAVVPSTLSVEPSPEGPIVATGSGYTLYEFTTDTASKSTCVTSACILEWPPVIAHGTPTTARGLEQGLVGTIGRPDGSRQVTYSGHPLYRWNPDVKPGMVTGQAVSNEGGTWYVVDPAGRPITTPFSVPS